MKKLYYYLTKYWPRRMPENEKEFIKTREVLVKYYGVEDEPENWHLVTSIFQATKPPSMRMNYGFLSGMCYRMKVNREIDAIKKQYYSIIEAKTGLKNLEKKADLK